MGIGSIDGRVVDSDTGPAGFPPVTRMLLHADGSTTRMLEALLGETLSLTLLDQRVSAASGLSDRVRELLACTSEEQVVSRRSELRVDGTAVSRNEVTVTCRDPQLTAILTDARIPIGHGLLASRRFLGRTVVSTGWDIWDGDEATACAYKEYVLTDETTAIAHIREQFNPALVPSGAAR
ncbi:chorismate--pyruvate lyase family protein [Nocardia sp. NPDC059180]|uniref:chorismate--pyruvate lyase family protein n=1 Tax=Nocardia sp. NPDC059180 TaxID=3346761 RepID=UPI00369B0ADE